MAIGDAILDAAWLAERKTVDEQIANALAAHLLADHARFQGLVSLGADFVAASSAASLPRCSVFGGNAGIVPGVVTTFDLTGVAFDPDGWANLATNTITVPDEGDYAIHFYVPWSPDGATDPSTGLYRILYLDLTPGADRSHRQDPQRDASHDLFAQETTLFEHLAAGTQLVAKVQHDASGNMIVGAALESLSTARLSVLKVG